MRINVSTAPTPKLQAPLDAVNGRATSHTITRPEEVRSIAREAETALDKLGLPQAHRRGARAEHVSGKGLPNAYRHTGIATRLLAMEILPWKGREDAREAWIGWGAGLAVVSGIVFLFAAA